LHHKCVFSVCGVMTSALLLYQTSICAVMTGKLLLNKSSLCTE